MIKFAFFDVNTKLPVYISSLNDDNVYKDGEVIDGKYIVKKFSTELSDPEILTEYYLADTEILKHNGRLSEAQIWDNCSYEWKYPSNYDELLSNEAASKVKLERQQLLATTDWTDTVSASTRLENYNAWQFYRQQLRDITTQEGYPFNVEWPTQPV
jgi:hypothetical protein